MKTFGPKFKKARQAAKLAQSVVADFIGMDKTNLSRLENGRGGVPTIDTVKKLASVPGIGVELSTLLEWQRLDEIESHKIEHVMPIPQNMVEIPVYGPPCAAGFPNSGDVETLEPVVINIFPKKDADGLFGLYVRGDSMLPELKDGDLLIVDKNRKAAHGSIVVACVDGEFTVKLLDIREDNQVLLVPMNNAYEAIDVTDKLIEAWPIFKIERFY